MRRGKREEGCIKSMTYSTATNHRITASPHQCFNALSYIFLTYLLCNIYNIVLILGTVTKLDIPGIEATKTERRADYREGTGLQRYRFTGVQGYRGTGV
jgi:hypothetical protein